jgi:hypothetical protein
MQSCQVMRVFKLGWQNKIVSVWIVVKFGNILITGYLAQ